MPGVRNNTREISYASAAETRAGRVVIRSVENLTGRLGLIRRAGDYARDVASGQDFWEVMAKRYGVELRIRAGALENIPSHGPLVVVANHPYGILDGLILGNILARTRKDFRILANQVFRKAEELDRIILPISFDETPAAVRTNISTRRIALEYLSEGGCIGVFPGGTVSTSQRPFGRPLDPSWRRFTARLIEKSGATVLPIFFEGQNSRLFQIASHLHSTLRLALMIKEFNARTGGPVGVAIGERIPSKELSGLAGDAAALMDYLRSETYRLSTDPVADLGYGFDFEEGPSAYAHRRF